MPSGNTHILLMNYLPDNAFDDNLKAELDSGMYFLYAGAVAPDLPYASIADNDLFLTTQTALADKFHYEKTNQIPLLAFSMLKSEREHFNTQEYRFAFSFFVGYMSHVIADGIMHPFVRDVVGDYKTNSAEHRNLEMQLDVLLFHHFTKDSGLALELNHAKLFEALRNLEGLPENKKVMSLFSRTIFSVYGIQCDEQMINNWLVGLYNLFRMAGNNYPYIIKNIKVLKTLLTPFYDDIKSNAEAIFTLTNPKDPRQMNNFLKRDKIHFLKDCLPRFYAMFIPLAHKAYAYVYDNGPEITVKDLAEIDLDTGRPVAQKDDMNLQPTYWI